MKFLLLFLLCSCAAYQVPQKPVIVKTPKEVQEDKTYACMSEMTNRLLGYGIKDVNVNSLTNACIKIYK
jgi:hypothetical protein